MIHLRPSDFTEMPWRNGGGVTHEIISKSNDIGLLWRVSTARVEADCDYSLFPGLQRISTVVEGNGVELTNTATGEVSLVRPFEIASLSGDILYQGKLINGGFRHLNLVFDPERVSAKMSVLTDGLTDLSARTTDLIYCCKGNICGAASGEVLLTEEEERLELRADSAGILISVSRPA